MHPVKLSRLAVGFSVQELAEYTRLNAGTIYRIEGGTSPFKTSYSVAEILAETFDCEVSDLFGQDELSHLGRPALTGTPITITQTFKATLRRGNRTETTTSEYTIETFVCGECWIQKSATLRCNCD